MLYMLCDLSLLSILDLCITISATYERAEFAISFSVTMCSRYMHSSSNDVFSLYLQPEFTAMREQYMRTGDGFLICYSVTDRQSFDEAIQYKKLINKVRNSEQVPCVLVGNKCDLDHQRKVSGFLPYPSCYSAVFFFHVCSSCMSSFLDYASFVLFLFLSSSIPDFL